ncbi:MAG: tRNA threonylcarbamoyladenosine dehydratase [Clostridia bacterium]|nr:tRNA threonylcarbamoyladenosine dehydratase [Clostridia bacterium]
MKEEFIRTGMLLGSEAAEKLARSRVAVFGLGGVGGYTVEALARSGVGALDLIDSDKIAPSNINRQILALQNTVGRYKADIAKERVESINPDCSVTVYKLFYLPDTADRFDFTQYDYIVDAIDTVTGKLAIIENAKKAGTPVISAMGTGNKLNPLALRVCNIYETSVCPLARIMRSELRKRNIDSLKVVCSDEPPSKPLFTPEEEKHSVRRDTPASVAFVPSVAGLVIAGEVIKDLTGINR